MPVIMRDSGSPSASGTNTLTIIIGDVNDNMHYSGHKNIHVYNYKGQFHMLLVSVNRNFFRPGLFEVLKPAVLNV